MKKRLQLALSNEAKTIIETVLREANENFDVGSITFSDVVNEMILNAKIDIKALQAKHTDIRKSLRKLAANTDLDLESAIKGLLELKGKTHGKKSTKGGATQEEAN